MSDAWDDEDFGGEDDWEGAGQLEADPEDEAISGPGSDVEDPQLVVAELEEDDDTLTDEEP
jgi:hypothetical protein